MGLKFSIQFFNPQLFFNMNDPISINNPKHEQPLLSRKKNKPIT